MSPLPSVGVLLIAFVAGVVSSSSNVTCEVNGYGCSADCSVLYHCPSATSSSRQVARCDTSQGQYCNAALGACSSTPHHCRQLQASTFQCTQQGYFPDPDDCTQYHVCMQFPNSNPEFVSVLDGRCDSGWAYDPVTTTCKYLVTDKVCTQGVVPHCAYVGQNGPLASNPNMFYICTMDSNGVLRPLIYECPHGGTYVTGSGCNTSPTTTSPVTTTTPPPIIDVCTKPGVFADPTNCHQYYICTDWLQKRHCACCWGFYYSPIRQRCVFGTC